MNDDFPWFLMAMVIIAFLRWVTLKLQGKSAEPDVESRAFTDDSIFEEDEQSPRTLTRTDPIEDPNEEIRRFFEVLGGPPAPDLEVAPPPPSPAPPPLPSPPPVPRVAAEKPAQPELSAIERAALVRIRAGEAASAGKARSHKPYAGKRRKRYVGQEFRSLLGSSEGLRAAIVLRETLGTPKGLKDL